MRSTHIVKKSPAYRLYITLYVLNCAQERVGIRAGHRIRTCGSEKRQEGVGAVRRAVKGSPALNLASRKFVCFGSLLTTTL